jgi:ADP-ribose pyrophosphatase
MPYDHLVDKQVIYDGRKIRVEVHALENEQGKRTRREVVVHPGAVVILPFLDAKTILLIRNKRYTVKQLLIELPAGTLEKDEDPMNGAGRELLEETGYLAGRLRPLGSFYSSPGILTETLYCFAAYDLERSQAKLDEDEEIQVLPTAFDEAISMIRHGEIKDGKTIATLLSFDRFHRGSPPASGKR